MESIDSRNLILPSPPRVERHSLVHFRPFWEGRNLFFHISPRCNASQAARTRPLVRRAHTLLELASTDPPRWPATVFTLLLAPLLRESIFHFGVENLSGGGAADSRTANMELQFLLLGSKWIREFCFIILLKTGEIYLLNLDDDQG